jgi:glycogen debranching enzyme
MKWSPVQIRVKSLMTWLLLGLAGVATPSDLAARIRENQHFVFVKEKALQLARTGFNAGEGYSEVWIRDYNTFIELSAEVLPKEVLKENLLVFLRLQGDDGNIVDGFVPRAKATSGYEYVYSELEPRYAGHKNTVETDQESSLVQAVRKYVQRTGDRSILSESVGGQTVAARLERAMGFLMAHRFNDRYGLLWGATTADWGDVQPEHDWGVYVTKDTHFALDIYDNAMFLIALDALMVLVPETRPKWQSIRKQVAKRARGLLWDGENRKFIPHIYLNGSPFPAGFDEGRIYYHGGTAVAIEAGLLSKKEVKAAMRRMVDNVKASGAASIGLTLYPPYPQGFFRNGAMAPYSYQNGGDWTWFGGRMIQQLIRYGFRQEAYELVLPMVERVKRNDGFYEWYNLRNEPQGSGTYRGEAGVLFKAIRMFEGTR